MNNSGESHQSSMYIVSFARSRATETAYCSMSGSDTMCLLQSTYPEVIPPVHIPLDVISRPLRGERFEPVRFYNFGPLVVRNFLVLLVVPMIWIDL